MPELIKNLGHRTILKQEEFLPHEEHQVISLSIHEGKSQSIIFFSFAAGEGIGRQILQEDVLYSVTGGKAEITVENTAFSIVSGQCILIPANVPHSIDTDVPFKMLQISVKHVKNIEPGVLYTMPDIVKYQEDKVASLTLVQEEGLTVTILAMDASTGVGPHISEGDALVYGLDGIGDVMIEEEHHVVKSGECIIMPANIPHGAGALEDSFKMLLIVVKPQL